MDAVTTVAVEAGEGQVAPVGELVVTIPAAAQLLGVSRSKLYELLGEGVLPTVRIGRSRRIADSDLEAFVRRCRDVEGSLGESDRRLPLAVATDLDMCRNGRSGFERRFSRMRRLCCRPVGARN